MKRTVLPIVLALAVTLLAFQACRGPRRIPKGDMTDIFYDMFLQEQVIRSNPEFRRQADTSLVYEGIFEKYGYDTDDYLYSLHYYLAEPERLAKIMDKVADRFSKEAGTTAREVRFLEWKARMMAIWQQQPDTLWPLPGRRPVDSLFLGMSLDSLLAPADTLRPDSLLFVRDSLLFPVDSL